MNWGRIAGSYVRSCLISQEMKELFSRVLVSFLFLPAMYANSSFVISKIQILYMYCQICISLFGAIVKGTFNFSLQFVIANTYSKCHWFLCVDITACSLAKLIHQFQEFSFFQIRQDFLSRQSCHLQIRTILFLFFQYVGLLFLFLLYW